MKLLIAAVLAASPAMADDVVFRGDRILLRLTEAPCTHTVVVDLILDEFVPLFHQGFGTVHGKQLAFCWVVSSPAEITIIDEKGDGGTFPMSAFSLEKGV